VSGTPKYSSTDLRRREQEKLAAERQRQAEAEARQRREAEERERARRLELTRAEVRRKAEEAERTLARTRSDLPQNEAARLAEQLRRLQAVLESGHTESAVRDVECSLLALTNAAERQAAAEAARRAELLRRRAKAEAAEAEIAALVEGLRADPVVQRWQYHRMVELDAKLREAHAAVRAGQYETPAIALAAATQRADDIVARANEAQLRAEKRDYIARSIRCALEQMGYVVSQAEAVDPGHPATALEFRAADAAGRAIGVEVPVDGPAYYTVDGFPHTAAPLAEGGSAPACDQAEAVLNQMRECLAADYGVDAGEILWDGKADPDRRLKRADELPSSGEARRSGR